MIKDIDYLMNRIDCFNDNQELCRWIDEYLESMEATYSDSEKYYLEEIKQNLLGMSEILLELKKHHMMTKPQQHEFDTSQKIDVLNLGMRTKNSLLFEGIVTIDDVLTRTKIDLLKMQNFGKKSLNELIVALNVIGLKLPG